MFIAVAYAGLGLLRRVLQFGAAYLSTDLGWRATNALRADLAAHCLSLDPPFHKAHTPGALIERVDGDVQALASFFSEFVLQVVGNLVFLGGILLALYLEDWRLGLGLTLLVALALGTLVRLRTHAVRVSAEERAQSASLFGFIEERLAALDDIRANGGSAYAVHRFSHCLRDYARTWWRADVQRSVFWLAMMILSNLANVLSFGLGAALLLAGRISLGTVYLLVAYVRMLFRPLDSLGHQLQAVQRAAAGVARTQELLDLRSGLADGPRTDLPAGALEVRFDGVSFAYEDGDQAVLRDLCFCLAPGTSVGLLGRTGSGKTTLSRLLFRLYDPPSGAIRLAGVALPELTLPALRRRVGLVTQDVQLFGASVRDNLTLFDPTVPDTALLRLIEELGLAEWFARLPEGLDTALGAGGRGLSAGEAQLLALARVYLKDPGLVVLDEPSARLDPATERLIERAMARLLEGRTVVVIAHRLATVERVEEIMIMEEGRIVEHGPRSHLQADPESRFARLLRSGAQEALA
jgi:ATP-binding cassette, subfamily B, bacterial